MVYFELLAASLVRLLPFALFFVSLALVTKKTAAWRDFKQGAGDIGTTIGFYVIDVSIVTPIAAMLAFLPVAELSLNRFAAPIWSETSPWLVLPAILLIGDYLGYWRHRVSHTPILWPIHVAHHSDRALNWFSLFRIHPLERLYTATVDSTLLALLGFPLWAIVANNFVRSSWGFFVHADLPWTLGKLGAVVISPSAHRWHHVRNEGMAGRNFANLFTFWDRMHRTYQGSGVPCAEATGVEKHH